LPSTIKDIVLIQLPYPKKPLSQLRMGSEQNFVTHKTLTNKQ